MLRYDTNRVVSHYRVADCPAVFSAAELVIPLHNLDPDPPDPDVSVLVFLGDGTVSLDEWAVGDPLEVLAEVPGEYPVGTVDVTSRLAACVEHGDPYLAFRLTTNLDRVDLGAVGAVEEPYLRVWP